MQPRYDRITHDFDANGTAGVGVPRFCCANTADLSRQIDGMDKISKDPQGGQEGLTGDTAN